jgi:hypothetical protein
MTAAHGFRPYRTAKAADEDKARRQAINVNQARALKLLRPAGRFKPD